jgi:nitroreductase
MNPKDYLEVLEWRYACKKFDPSASIDPSVMDALEESLRLAPSSIGLQPWYFVVVADQDLKKSLRGIAMNQSQVEDCSRFVVMCALRDPSAEDVERYLARVEEMRAPSAEKMEASRKFYSGVLSSRTPEERAAWAENQVYLALGFLLSAAALMKVDSCAIGSLDGPKCDVLLGLDKTPYRTVLGVALGYRSPEDTYAAEAKVRFLRGDVLETR